MINYSAKAATLIAASMMTFNVLAITCADLDGAYVYSQENTPVYLGFFGSQFASESIMNEFGTYGSQFSSFSVRNEFGTYGSPFNTYSATNEFTATPPRIYKYGAFISYLTANTTQIPGVSLPDIDGSCQFFATEPYNSGSPTLPDPPSQVDASDGTDPALVLLSWSSVSDATGYNVYYSDSLNSTKNFIGPKSGTSMEITGATPGVVFYFWVFSTNAAGESSTGSYDTGFVQTESPTLPDPPSQVDASDGTDPALVLLSWSSVSDATGYNVYYSDSLNSTKNFIGPTSGTSMEITGATPGVVFYFWVFSTNAAGESSTGSYDMGFVQTESPTLPDPPSQVDASDGTDPVLVLLSWSSVSDATGYNVYDSDSLNSTKNFIGSTSGTSMEITGPTPGVVFYFWVFSTNAAGESSTGSYDTGFAKDEPTANVPDAPTLTSAVPGDGSVTLNFVANGDGGSEITGFTTKCGAFSQSGSSSPITVSGLTNDTTYSCSVTAINAEGSSLPSASRSATPEDDQGPAPTFHINVGQAGAWFNPETPGQGQLLDVEPESKFMFVSWFTFTDAASADPKEQHWFTAQGNYSGNTADLIVYETLGGQFDDPQEVSTDPVGVASLSFSECGLGQMSYSIETWGVEGAFPMQRAIPGTENVCQQQAELSNEPLDENDGWDGAWYDEETPGQGFLIDAHPNPEGDDFIFVAWFTYGDDTASGQRWLTAQGPLVGTTGDLVVYETTGGSFDEPITDETKPVGTITIDFTDCSHASLTYSLTDEGLDESIQIQRTIPGTDALCQELSG